MTGRPLPVESTVGSPPPIPPTAGVKGIVFIGIGLVLAVVIAAFAFGFVRSAQVEGVSDRLIGTHTDGWTTQKEPDDTTPGGSVAPNASAGNFSVELPGDRTRETVNFTGTNDGKLTVWTAKIVDDTILQAGWGPITPPPPGVGPNGTFADQGPTRQIFLEGLADRWMAGNRITSTLVTKGNTSFGNMPAYQVRATTTTATVKDKPAYTQAAFAINGDKLYVLTVTSVYRENDLLDRMMSTFQLTA